MKNNKPAFMDKLKILKIGTDGALEKYLCPVCKQNLKDSPHDGLDGKDCPRCGQGLHWKYVGKLELNRRANKEKT